MLQRTCWTAAAAVVLSIGWVGVSAAATLNVPGDFATIQTCIDAAVSGVDECVVAPGTYHETINFLGKAITLRSSGGRDVTTIDATGIGGSVVTCATDEGPETILDGFTITGGTGIDDGSYGKDGGGMYNFRSSPTVINCTFSGNKARGSEGLGAGGGMYNYDSGPTVTNCSFSRNTAYAGGGMVNIFGSSTVTNCTFSGNTASLGGGMINVDGRPTVTNCAFSGNAATDAGGGMYNSGDSPNVANCAFSGNKASYGGGMFNVDGCPTVTNCIFWGDSPDQVVDFERSTTTFRFSDVQGGLPVGAVDGGGNVDLDPVFVREANPGPDGNWDGVDDDYGDLRLQAGSPCIDAGDPGFVAQPGETDLEGHARVLCGRVDMGAYEFGIGDYDCNQSVNLYDFANWSSCMNGPQATALADEPPVAPSCEAFDFDGDRDVDLLDFAGFQDVFQGSLP
jgi:hypothetical protein